MVQGREILLIVTGGIAAYKSAELTSRLVQDGALVSVVMTTHANKFIGPVTFEALTGRPVFTEMFLPREHYRGEHIGLANRSELVVVAPASANYIAKVAHGIADDLASTLALSCTAPIMMAPAMNTEMWNKPSVQRNLKQVEEDGIQIISPGSGWLSCGQVGIGRMADPDQIYQTIETHFQSDKK